MAEEKKKNAPYDPKPVEAKWYDRWMAENLFHAEPKDKAQVQPYVVVIPPPNITGALHMGHALNNTLQDTVIRYNRMRGKEACWVPGTDHGGIATQNVVEKQLKGEGKVRTDLGREAFLKRMWEWRQECGDTILMQLRRLGCALNWERKRFTMEEPCTTAVFDAFARLWDKGLIYRGKRMINWCVRCHTALSDIEVEHEEQNSKLWHIHYPLEDGGQGPVVATTRPETMLGDTAVAVHPDDERNKHLVGKKVRLPLTDRLIPVIADDYVEMEFGTGALKVTPAHDQNDFEIGKRHGLSAVTCIDFSGKMTPESGAAYAGLSREAGRKKILEDLKEGEFLVDEKPHRLPAAQCYRCHQMIEPLVSPQWFMKMESLAAPAIEAIETGKVRYSPDNWGKDTVRWLSEIHDWCLSRQIWWGHRIPVWYDAKVHGDSILVWLQGDEKGRTLSELLASGKTVEEIESQAKTIRVDVDTEATGQSGIATSQPDSGTWIQDPDVLDTWFSSALWPFSVFGWPEKTKDLDYFYPTSLLCTGSEIRHLWVSRMIMMGIEFLGKVPFSDVYIHGIVRDKSGKKMSKSLGNVIDPLDLMEQYGTDAVRFSLTAQAVPGKDIKYSEDSLVGPRNFVNKLWNVARFVRMYLPENPVVLERPAELSVLDRWILSRCGAAIEKAEKAFEGYNLALAADTLYGFVWDELCDWYVEWAKPRLQGEDGAEKAAAQFVLVEVMSLSLRALHPIMPFVTEEISTMFAPYRSQADDLLLANSWPEAPKRDSEAEEEIGTVQGAVRAIRAVRSQFTVPPGKKLDAVAAIPKEEPREILSRYEDMVRYLARLETFSLSEASEKPAQSATAVVEGGSIYVPLAGIIDLDKERSRISKELERLAGESKRLDGQLSNKNFVERAPKENVEKVRSRLGEVRQAQGRLEKVLSEIS